MPQGTNYNVRWIEDEYSEVYPAPDNKFETHRFTAKEGYWLALPVLGKMWQHQPEEWPLMFNVNPPDPDMQQIAATWGTIYATERAKLHQRLVRNVEEQVNVAVARKEIMGKVRL